MTIETLMQMRNSNEAPFDHREYTIWLHNKIVDSIQYELWEFREKKAMAIKSSYASCNHIMSLPSLKIIK